MLPRVIAFALVLCFFAIGLPKMAGSLFALTTPQAANPSPQKPTTAARPAPAPTATATRDDTTRYGSGRRATLRADPRGHFLAEATVNGRSIDVMVDTGATSVALTDDTARRLGIRPARSAYSVRISTANGTAFAAVVKLGEVRIGGVTVRDVEALVARDGALEVNLLGMSFLSRLSKFEMAGGQLVLTQ